LEVIITVSEEVLKDFESDMAVRIRMLGGPTPETAETHDSAKQTVGS
jgi:hypothetical protein